MSAARFRCYLEGTTPEGAAARCRGARDQSPSREDRPLRLPHRLYFAGTSTSWGGSPSFIDVTPCQGDPPTLARAYLITWEQFEDVVAQENARPDTAPIDHGLATLAPGDGHLLGDRRYENLLCVGRLEGHPVFTFTSPWSMADAALGEPAPAYLQTMINGLREAHGLCDDALRGYLGAAPGCSEALVASVLTSDPAESP